MHDSYMERYYDIGMYKVYGRGINIILLAIFAVMNPKEHLY